MTYPEKYTDVTQRYENGHLFRPAMRLGFMLFQRCDQTMTLDACFENACLRMGIDPADLQHWRRKAWNIESCYTPLPF